MSDIQIVLAAAKGRGWGRAISLVTVVSIPIGAVINWGGPFFHALYEAAGSIFVGMT